MDNKFVLIIDEQYNLNAPAQIEKSIIGALNSGYKKIIIDLSQCSYIISVSVGLFVKLHQKCKIFGAELFLQNPSTNILDFLTFTELDKTINILNPENEPVPA